MNPIDTTDSTFEIQQETLERIMDQHAANPSQPDGEVPESDPRDNGCLCQRCETRYKVDVMVSDELWANISPGQNLLCGLCIIRAIEDLDVFDYYDLRHGDTSSPDSIAEKAERVAAQALYEGLLDAAAVEVRRKRLAAIIAAEFGGGVGGENKSRTSQLDC